MDELELTSETNPEKRKEAKRIFDAYDPEQDLEQYQAELKRSKKS